MIQNRMMMSIDGERIGTVQSTISRSYQDLLSAVQTFNQLYNEQSSLPPAVQRIATDLQLLLDGLKDSGLKLAATISNDYGALKAAFEDSNRTEESVSYALQKFGQGMEQMVVPAAPTNTPVNQPVVNAKHL